MSERLVFRNGDCDILCNGASHIEVTPAWTRSDGPCTCGADEITFVDRFSVPKYVSRGDQVLPHPEHTHVFGWFRRRCKICGITRRELK